MYLTGGHALWVSQDMNEVTARKVILSVSRLFDASNTALV
jgi:hypothetical protein